MLYRLHKNVSSTWRGADAFGYYWQNNAIAYKKFTSYTIDAWNYGFKGYAVSLLTSTGRAYHTLIIVGYDSVNKDLICAAHTGNTNTASLKSKASGAPGGFIIYKTW
ncbi:amidase domain-containing protein [Caloramator sp. mosi_1]|uniref:amidase domain-containing protein n=1 Tax=Caloramator sp. mosi_1 TaxID=3023090 RepID=UPI003FCD73DA